MAEIDSDGFDFRVAHNGVVWSYPERVPGKPRDIAVLEVGGEAEKQALLLDVPEVWPWASAGNQQAHCFKCRRWQT